ncbi:class I SAM-dependent methyltransferase [Actinokineospora iranica]|uniref:S-adenosylmethionine-dependent methyltransferase n=1 Tax=Actinokineospora iranica TaxID=1271860 RepID=A0A1G6LQW5_9PSEU|nr:methyltransferase domain-containing protein [Actinokineospora iranica]SDC45650.1 S-adenosylmethionine-dependent methyltransferase [Actinokineospora iranica]
MTVEGIDARPDALTRLRHSLAEANLVRHLPRGRQRILDVAGGGGRDSVRFAERGHEVTLLDPAGAMLAGAMRLADAHGVADRLHVVQATAEDTPHLFAPHEFDVVLCHNLLHFTDDREALLRAVTAALRPGGLLSVVNPNPAAEPLRAARRLDLDQALRALDSPTTHVAPLGVEIPACEAAAVTADLTTIGATVLAHYGIRCVADYLAEEAAADPTLLPGLERLELALSARLPYLLTARYFHLVARITGPVG